MTSLVRLVREARPLYVWSALPAAAVRVSKLHILGLEARLGPRRSFSVGMIFGSQNQWKEQDMFETTLSPLHTTFLRSLGEELEVIDLSVHRLKLATNFYGFEVNLHVAPLLSPDERRQYIGNDKVIIFCLEESEKPFVPRFSASQFGWNCLPKEDWGESMVGKLQCSTRIALQGCVTPNFLVVCSSLQICEKLC